MNNLSGDIQWRVRSEKSDVWTSGENFTANAAPGSNLVQATKNWELDMIFANFSGVWEAGFSAQHQGAVGSWKGTLELVSLYGNNKVDDLFEGSSDANVFLLSDEINGDALFVDDIYSHMAASADPQARIIRISEIRAGMGDDIVDMTSQRFTYSGTETAVYGGEGNDTIWGGAVSNRLFGDSGNDRLVGASGDDILAGGSGDDSMHGGGGKDIFSFGSNWGNDTVEQLAGGSVTLWFEEGSMAYWNASSMTYSDGRNSVRVSGTADVTLVFGRTDDLGIEGAFEGEASSKIFSEIEKGLLA
jgi:Ca2+-binding RTX toxin-like protein